MAHWLVGGVPEGWVLTVPISLQYTVLTHMVHTPRGVSRSDVRAPSGDERYASKRPHHVNYMYFTISKTPRIFIWVQSGPEFCAREYWQAE